jgi:signal transduction histidine kinase
MVNADYDLTDQVFSNIFSNAINHIDENKTIRISFAAKPNKIIVSVFNTGENIPQESLDKIWDSFYKVDKARTREYGGSGLGLKIVKTILDADNNAYGVQNLNGGVEFWFELDRKPS